MKNNKDKKTEFEDVYSDSNKKPTYKKGYKPLEEREVYYPNKFFEFMLKNNKRNTKIILVCILVLLAASVAMIFFSGNYGGSGVIGSIGGNPGKDNDNRKFNDKVIGKIIEDDTLYGESVDDILKKWYNNGSSECYMGQKYVTNVLLLGVDGENTVENNGGNSDSMILVSINEKTQKITLVSFMRDSRTYYNANGADRYLKANAVFSRGGGPEATVKMIESNFKIDIDHYVAVDFTTFSEVVDALGGVTLNIEQYEQEYINRTTTKIKKIPNYGTVTLDGDQALVYCRIRKSDADSDVSRTRRQRNFISALIASAKDASLGQLKDAVTVVLKHLRTDCSKTKVLGYAADAVRYGWMDYEIVQITMPDEDVRKNASFGGVFYWVVDYPVAAQKVQTAIYGTTNIVLAENRTSALDRVKYDSDPPASSADGQNEPEGETGTNTEETTTHIGLLPDWIFGDKETTSSDSQEDMTTGTDEGETVSEPVNEEPGTVAPDATEPAA